MPYEVHYAKSKHAKHFKCRRFKTKAAANRFVKTPKYACIGPHKVPGVRAKEVYAGERLRKAGVKFYKRV